ncbi:MAG TPA: type IV toxin-antitoxin system AbiEi family antitoxin domain-containing protein [Acidimicrobiia bacterium]
MGHQRRQQEELTEALHELRLKVIGDSPVFRIAQAEAAGFSRPLIRSLVRSKLVYRIRHGAYVESALWDVAQRDPAVLRRLLASAAVVGMVNGAFAYGALAAEVHGLPLAPGSPRQLELVRDLGSDRRPARSRGKPRNLIQGVHLLTRDLRGEDTTSVNGLPVVSLASAAVTAAAQFPREYAVSALDGALARGVDSTDLAAVVARWRAGRGISAVPGLIDLARVGAESPLESISRIRLLDRGVPEPELQHEFRDGRGFVARVDFWWPRFRVVGEADGMSKYTAIQEVRAEKHRQDLLSALGVTIVRWTWDEIWNHPTAVARRILAAGRKWAA